MLTFQVVFPHLLHFTAKHAFTGIISSAYAIVTVEYNCTVDLQNGQYQQDYM